MREDAEASRKIPSRDVRGWELCRPGKCSQRDSDPLPVVHDEFWARYDLQQLKRDPLRMAALRQMLVTEIGTSSLHRITDEDAIDSAVRLLSSGAWHIHSRDARRVATEESTGTWTRVPGTAPSRLPSRRTLPVKTKYGNCLIVRRQDLIPGEEFLEDPSPVLLEITVAARDPRAQHALAEIVTAFPGVRPMFAAQPEISWPAQRVENAFLQGTLVLVREEMSIAGGGKTAEQTSAAGTQAAGSPSRGQSAAIPPVIEKTWFRMQLLDEDGDPMAGEDYLVVDTQGCRRQGKLDSNGELYIPPILPPGDCTINFPEIHLNPRKR